METQPFGRGALGQAHALQGRPMPCHGRAQALLGTFGRVGGDHVQSTREEARGPARADHAGADDGDGSDRGHRLFQRAQRDSALVVQAASPAMVSTTL